MKLNLAIEIANGFDQDSKSPTALAVDPRKHIENRIKSTLDAMGLTEWPEGASPILMKLDGTNKSLSEPRTAPYLRDHTMRPLTLRIQIWEALDGINAEVVIEYKGARRSGDNADRPVIASPGPLGIEMASNAVHSFGHTVIFDHTEPDAVVIGNAWMLAATGIRVVLEPIPHDCPVSEIAGYSSYTNILARKMLDGFPVGGGVIYVGFDGRAKDKAKLPITTEDVLAVIHWARDGGARELWLCIHGPAHAKAVWEAYSQESNKEAA